MATRALEWQASAVHDLQNLFAEMRDTSRHHRNLSHAAIAVQWTGSAGSGAGFVFVGSPASIGARPHPLTASSENAQVYLNHITSASIAAGTAGSSSSRGGESGSNSGAVTVAAESQANGSTETENEGPGELLGGAVECFGSSDEEDTTSDDTVRESRLVEDITETLMNILDTACKHNHDLSLSRSCLAFQRDAMVLLNVEPPINRSIASAVEKVGATCLSDPRPRRTQEQI